MNDVIQVWQFAIPVALAALGETVGQRSGVLNIGLEGTMLGAAYVGVVVAIQTGNPWLGLLAGLFLGVLSSVLQAWFCVRQGADQVVVGTAWNLLALGVTGTLFRSSFGQSGQLLDVPSLPRSGGLDVVMVLTLVLALGLFIAIRSTNWGLMVRAAGEEPKAVEAEGFRVDRIRLGVQALAGALAGVAGAYLSVGLAGSFAENMTAGRGFVAIALVTFGRWNPLGVMAAAMLMGYLEVLQFKFQASGSSVPFQLLLALPYLAALAVLIVAGKGTRSPAALGLPFRRSS